MHALCGDLVCAFNAPGRPARCWSRPACWSRALTRHGAQASQVPAAPATQVPSTPPLQLSSSASVASAAIGQEFQYTMVVTGDRATPQAVELRAAIDAQLEVLGAAGGQCSAGATVICGLRLQPQQLATITIAVRVRASARRGTVIGFQALAQDDAQNTAASERIQVMIAPDSPTRAQPAQRAACANRRASANHTCRAS
ncbi:MAG: hypothetical protein IPP13_14870 [Kouleothrix sp.]|nr:hypothetical protein [Kouleothrix sp.]